MTKLTEPDESSVPVNRSSPARESPSPGYSLVVPVFNESKVIASFCKRARETLTDPYELLICYDSDEDETLPALRAIPSKEKPLDIRLIKNTLGPGVRYAIEAGMRASIAPVVVVAMADLADDLADTPAMLQRIGQGADLVCASRYMRGGRQIGGPRFKGWLSRAAGLSLHWLAGVPTHDATNSFKAYRRDLLMEIPIESTAGFSLGIELVVKAHALGRRVEEIPTTWRDRSDGESRFRLLRWLPHYLRWYFWALKQRLFRRRDFDE